MNGLRTHHVSFAVTDLASSKQSDGTVLGLAEIERFEMGIGGACYRAGDTYVRLIVRPAGAETRTPPPSPICAAPVPRCSKPVEQWDNSGCAIGMGT